MFDHTDTNSDFIYQYETHVKVIQKYVSSWKVSYITYPNLRFTSFPGIATLVASTFVS